MQPTLTYEANFDNKTCKANPCYSIALARKCSQFH